MAMYIGSNNRETLQGVIEEIERLQREEKRIEATAQMVKTRERAIYTHGVLQGLHNTLTMAAQNGPTPTDAQVRSLGLTLLQRERLAAAINTGAANKATQDAARLADPDYLPTAEEAGGPVDVVKGKCSECDGEDANLVQTVYLNGGRWQCIRHKTFSSMGMSNGAFPAPERKGPTTCALCDFPIEESDSYVSVGQFSYAHKRWGCPEACKFCGARVGEDGDCTAAIDAKCNGGEVATGVFGSGNQES